jgi:5'(3')-deoxyribonucleotidase
MPKTENKPVIVVDIDEVLFPMAATFLNYYNHEHKTNYTVNDMDSYYVEDMTGETEEQLLAKIRSYISTPHYKNAQPLEGSAEAIQRLSEEYELAILTARDDFYRGSTENFVEAHYPGVFSSVQYTHQIESPHIFVPKFEICKELGAIAIIDDSLKNVIECAEHGIDGILFGEYAWNKTDQLPHGVTRLNDWQEVAEHFGV